MQEKAVVGSLRLIYPNTIALKRPNLVWQNNVQENTENNYFLWLGVFGYSIPLAEDPST